jgi:WASH complex subunit 7
MKSLAQEKLGLSLTDNFLPMGSLDQGLDILQIMRNIHIFVNRFAYDMNMQQFMEYRPDKNSKHLNTIKIPSIAASIRQHGLGILNTTVNYTYQFLVQKFDIFSQFLFDDYIRAHLLREYRWYKKHKSDPDVSNTYPYDRALKFVREIKKLGINDTGKSFLDLFRILITEIGNALGYVRMVRSASMYACSEAIKFLPDFEHVVSFGILASDQMIKIDKERRVDDSVLEGKRKDDETDENIVSLVLFITSVNLINVSCIAR